MISQISASHFYIYFIFIFLWLVIDSPLGATTLEA